VNKVATSIASPAPLLDPARPVVIEEDWLSAGMRRVTITSFVRGELPEFARRRGLGPYLRAIMRRR